MLGMVWLVVLDRLNRLSRSSRLSRLNRLNRFSRLERLSRVNRMSRLDRLSRLDKLSRLNRLSRLDRLGRLDMPLGFGPSGDWHVIIFETIVNLAGTTRHFQQLPTTYLIAGGSISLLTVARHRGQLGPGASSRDLGILHCAASTTSLI